MASQVRIDPALVDQMMDLNNRQTELRRHLAQLTEQLAKGERDQAAAKITLEELDRLPAETKTYKGVGRMYVLEDKEKLKGDLVKDAKDVVESCKAKFTLREQFAKKLKESETQSEELVTAMTKMMANNDLRSKKQ